MTDRRVYDARQWAASRQRIAGTESVALAAGSTVTSGSTASVSVGRCFDSAALNSSSLEQSSQLSSSVRFDPNTSRSCRPTDIVMGRQSMGQIEVDVPVVLRQQRYRPPSEAHDSWRHPPRQLQQPLPVSLLQDPDAFGLGGLPKPLPPTSLFAAGVDRSLMTFHHHEQQPRQRANPEQKPSHAAESAATAAAAAAAGFISYAALLKSIQERSAGAEISLASSTSPQSGLSIPSPATMPLISSPLHQPVFPHHPHNRHPRTQYQFQQLTGNPQLPDASDSRAQAQLRHVPLAVRFPNLPHQQSTSSSFSSVESSTTAGTTASKLWAALSPLANKTAGLFGPTSASQMPADSAFQHQFPMAAAALAYGSWFQQPLRAAAAAAAARFRSPFICDAKPPRLATSSSPGQASPPLVTPTTSPVVWRHRSDSGPASSSPLPPSSTTVVARLTPGGGVSPVGSEEERLRKKRRAHLSSDEGSSTAASIDLMSPRSHTSGRSDFPTIHAVVTAAVHEDIAATSQISSVTPLLQLPAAEQRIGPASSWPPSLLAEAKPSRRCAGGSAPQFSTPTSGTPSCRSEAVGDADRAASRTSQRPPSSPTAVSIRRLSRMPPASSSSSSLPQLSHFTRGSLIDLGDGISKRVEEMDTGDFLRCNSTDFDLQLEMSTVVYMEDHAGGDGGDRNKFVLVFAVGRSGKRITVEAAADHPFFVFGVGWSSCLPTLTLERYGLQCRQLLVGDLCISLTNCPQNDGRRGEQVPSVGALVHSRPVEFPPAKYRSAAAGGPVGHELSSGRLATSSSTLASGQADVSRQRSDDRLFAGVSGQHEIVRSSAASTSLAAESLSRRPRRVRNGLENVEQQQQLRQQQRPVMLPTVSASDAAATETSNRKRRWSASDVGCDVDPTTLQQQQHDLTDESAVSDSMNATVQATLLGRTTVTHREGFDVFSMNAASANSPEDRKTRRPPSPTT